jgi:hypothetical protein
MTLVPCVVTIAVLAIYTRLLLPTFRSPMTYQLGFSTNNQASLSNNAKPVEHLSAQNFSFETRIVPSSDAQTPLDQYTEQITQENGAFDIILLRQGNGTKYLIKVSSVKSRHCSLVSDEACQQRAARTRGNAAEIQITLSGTQIKPGSYAFKGGSTPNTEVITYSRKLYSDPSYGQLGCQVWGGGTFNVKEAIYDQKGDLVYLDANLERHCDRTAPFLSQEDSSPQAQAENIKRYTLHFAWNCRLKGHLKR